ncbi:RNA polymerase sigma factor [Plebeiibacterium sediminum]|uniref:Sigma-70 family RNA polymerase sigma factor n=1 Tax=Plebeiibacterium sediminum TaxID=2992112 RepID=A0AAE3SEU9_9BACT|nr:sigma-70 family RNA polymerase sigma factor [Plebeiobacterium sediminum]MCW3786571.1 sigma-70 family RNA polymerase sigma factor [Plebeiobacterium sediminum]
MSDFDIIKEILNGNKDQYRFLIERYQDQIFRACMGYVHCEEDANDLTQETFIKVYQKLSNFKFNAAFSTWIYRIAINLSLNFLRKKKGNLFDRIESALDSLTSKPQIQISDYSNPEDILITNEHTEMISKVIESLSDKQKTAFVLSKYEELSQKEIATIMEITEGAVESLLQRAKANLQKKISHLLKKN